MTNGGDVWLIPVGREERIPVVSIGGICSCAQGKVHH